MSSLSRLLALAAAFSLASCQLTTEAEKATCDSVSPKYGSYVEADPLLTDEDKARTHRLIRTWRMRVGLPPLDQQPSESRWEAATGVAPQSSVYDPDDGQAGVGMLVGGSR